MVVVLVVVVPVGTVVVVVGGEVVVVVPPAGITVMVTVAVDVWPAPLETVSVYVVVTDGVTVTESALGIAPMLLSTVAVTPE